MPVWLNPETGNHAVVLWHASQDDVVLMCFAVLPLTFLLLWQLAQVPATTLAWLKLTTPNPTVL